MKFTSAYILFFVVLFFQGCGAPAQEELEGNSAQNSIDPEACKKINRITTVPCGSSAAQLSIAGMRDVPIYGAAEFTSIPLHGFCSRGDYHRAEVQARLYRGNSQLVVKSPSVPCNGTFTTSLPISGVSENDDYTLELEIVGVSKEGRRFTNLPYSKARTPYLSR